MLKLKIWAPECLQNFPSIWHIDLVFDLIWPSFELVFSFIGVIRRFQHYSSYITATFELVQDLMEMNVLINFHEDRLQNVACRVLTRANADDGQPTTHDTWTTDKMWSQLLTLHEIELKIRFSKNEKNKYWVKLITLRQRGNWAISPFTTIFSKVVCCRGIQKCMYVGKG